MKATRVFKDVEEFEAWARRQAVYFIVRVAAFWTMVGFLIGRWL